MNEGPTDITFTGGTVNETVEDGGTIGSAFDPSGTTVATLSTTDQDASETFTYSITNDPSGHFEIVGNEVRVKAGQTIDYETATSHDLTVEVTDGNGSTYSETITINVEDYEGSYTGASNADTHTGTSEEDTVSTGNGSDTIIGSDGADSIDGGTGYDTVDYSSSTEGVTVNFETGQGSGGQAEGDTYTNVENVIGSDHDDNIKGTFSEGTVADLGDGNDRFDNTQGHFNQHDTIDAGAGNDTVYTGDGNDTIDGGTGNDQLFGEGGNDTIDGGDGNDTIRGGEGDDTITGGAGDDVISGGGYLAADNDTVVYSGNWADYTITQSGSNFIITDNRPGSPDGTDTVNQDVENFQFADATVPQADILNDAPTDITVTGGNIDENSTAGTVVATLGTTDADSFIPSETATYSITNDPSGNFEIVGNEVRVKAGSTLDFESDTNHDITVQVTDVHGATYSETITINLNDVDEFDVSAVTDTDTTVNYVSEHDAVGTSVKITASATDADATDTVTYSLSDDAGGLFTIDTNTGEITVAGSLDYETATSHNVTVVATSSDGSTSNETFTINLNDENEFDVSAITDTDSSTNSVAENVSVGTAVGITAFASDADGSNNTVTYSLSDNAGGLFAIDPNTGEVTVAGSLDYEAATSHNIEVTATSADGSTSTQSFTINVNDINEAPTDITFTGNENLELNSSGLVAANSVVADATSVVDVDAGDTFTFALTDNANGNYTINSETGEITATSDLDPALIASDTVTVQVTDSGGNTFSETIGIHLGTTEEETINGSDITDIIYGFSADTSIGASNTVGTSFSLIYLGTAADVDPNEAFSDGISENASSLLGSYGDYDNPLYDQIVSASVNDADLDNIADDNDFANTPETVTIDGVGKNIDSTQVYNATVTFTDGTTGTFTAVVSQYTDGTVYLNPEFESNADSALLTSKPIAGVSLNSVIENNTDLVANRLDMDYAIPGGDTLNGGGGDDYLYGGEGNDTLNGGDGNDILNGDSNVQSYTATVNAHEPVAYLKLSDTSSTAIDETSNNHDAIYQGDSTSGVTGAIASSDDTAATFDGSGDYVEIPASTDFQLPEGTITLWFNTSDLSTTQTLISRDSSNFDGGGHLNITIDTNGQIDVRHQTSSTSHYIDSGTTTVATGEWHQLSYSWGADGMKLYIDDQLVDSDPTVLTLEGNNEPFTIGASQWKSGDGVANNLENYFEGQIDEVAIFDQALTLDEIQDLNDASNIIVGDNTLNGEAGDDTLISGAGNDIINGGADNDTVDYSQADAGITVDISNTAAQDTGGAGTDTITNVENVTGSSFDDTITGDNSSNTILGGAGNDTILYGEGGDTVYGGEGNDIIDDISGAHGGNYNDYIDAGAGNDTVWTGSGDDTIIGGAGNDTLNGEDGNDLFIFQEGDGADIIYGGSGSSWTDTIELQDATGGSDIGTYGTDWTVTLTEGSIEETNSDNIIFSDDADGTITLQDGSSIDFTDIERIDW